MFLYATYFDMQIWDKSLLSYKFYNYALTTIANTVSACSRKFISKLTLCLHSSIVKHIIKVRVVS